MDSKILGARQERGAPSGHTIMSLGARQERGYMLVSLLVKNFALIEKAEVEFFDGLNILTGETGAGKSIIIGSINIALGGKVSKEIIRSDAQYAFVELVFEIRDEHQIKQLADLDVFLDDYQLVISRKIMKNRSVSKVNGETVTNAVLKKIASIVIDIHGQHEHQSLLSKQKHLQILDEFTKEELSKPKEKMAKLYNTYTSLQNQLADLDLDDSTRERESSFLQYEIDEINKAGLSVGEDIDLERQYKKMTNSQMIAKSLSDVYEMLVSPNDMNVSRLVGSSVQELSTVMTFDESIVGFREQLLQIEDLLGGLSREISIYLEDIEFDDEDFQAVSDRLDLINHLKSKYGQSIEEILFSLGEKQRRLDELTNYSTIISDLKLKIEKCEKDMIKTAEVISKNRKKYAKVLAEEIRHALLDMNFLDVKFDIKFEKKDSFSANGMDEAEFLISTNPGEEPLALGKIASGGELSRIMLAIKTVLASKDYIDTMIFDEIDVGISGRTAQKISEKMGVLSKTKQIICITHLPQIAAMADSHFVIEKNTNNNETVTTIRLLDEEEIYEELARLLGGVRITDAVMENAREMKKLAKQSSVLTC